MLDTIFEEVKDSGVCDEHLLDEIMKRVKKYNFISPTIEEALTKEIFKAYKEFIEEKR